MSPLSEETRTDKTELSGHWGQDGDIRRTYPVHAGEQAVLAAHLPDENLDNGPDAPNRRTALES